MVKRYEKTQMCPWLAKGFCKRGEKCDFAHSEDELRSRPDLKKTRLCVAFMKGECLLQSDQCEFAHGEEERRFTDDCWKTQICKKWLKGECTKRNPQECSWAHGHDELRVPSTSSLPSSSSSSPPSSSSRPPPNPDSSTPCAALSTSPSPSSPTSPKLPNASAGGETDLKTLLRTMAPILDPKRYVYVALKNPSCLPFLKPRMVFWEEEGLCAIVCAQEARESGLMGDASFPCRRITLSVHSALDAVGFLAAVTTALAQKGISTNAVAALCHDHLFVPEEDAEKAVEVLLNISGPEGKSGSGLHEQEGVER
uniref:C3H1-type domain-containing protein n=1 Tax=Chromera velia CCMP2878 TaxID=1169474 RepID=A0A0G4ID31_9ALVE|eukprot:Cvel_13225.t1-p1 / transcript=Cvel_13225.t1 / gene=Cvel_13225 / organism=Chromera_velia_CCMP2878 / gene_product=hypothetical protein / transcript_product=hypothetical protein / location=Cvel_scaffold895:48571-51780(+) / protein_length=310 / sequence_SO=supercontig / SO=protein_coding / is_pseudo=false